MFVSAFRVKNRKCQSRQFAFNSNMAIGLTLWSVLTSSGVDLVGGDLWDLGDLLSAISLPQEKTSFLEIYFKTVAENLGGRV